MSRTIHRLTTRVVAAAKPRPGKRVMLADGGNLLLQVTGKPDGKFSRSWIFRYERDGKRPEWLHGSFVDALADAQWLAANAGVAIADFSKEISR